MPPQVHTLAQAISYLTRDGNLKVPASRYGADTRQCAPIAYVVARIIAANTDRPPTGGDLEHAMALVVNNHDDPLTLIRQHGTHAEQELLADLIEQAQVEDWIAEARDLGRDAGRNAASWAADGNTTDEHRRNVLALMEAGDPEADRYLPDRPHLYGDDPTPTSIYLELTGNDELDADDSKLRDSLAEAWEDGARDVFEQECERELRSGLPDTA